MLLRHSSFWVKHYEDPKHDHHQVSCNHTSKRTDGRKPGIRTMPQQNCGRRGYPGLVVNYEWNRPAFRADAEGLEVSQVDEHNAFKDLGKGGNPGQDYKKIKVHMAHAIKHDGCHKVQHIGCVMDNRQMHGATRTCLTKTPRDVELILDFEVILQFRSRLISLFL